MKKLWCTNFTEFERIAKSQGWDKKVPKDIAIISINNGHDAGTDEEYHVCKGDNVLNLDFDDVDPVALDLDENTETYKYIQQHNGKETIIEFFTEKQAKESVKFIEDNKDKNFYIHCSAGISRSQAFVKYIQHVYQGTEWETNPINACKFPNGFVFQKLMQAWRELSWG